VVVADALHVVEVLATSTGGIGTHVHGLAAGLVERGITVTVAGPQATEDSFGFTSVGAAFEPVEIATRPRPRADLEAIRALRSLISALAAGRPERDSGTADLDHDAVPLVVHAHGLRAGLVAGLATRSTMLMRRSRRRAQRPRGLRRPHPSHRPGHAPLVVTWHNAVLGKGPARFVLAGLEGAVARMADVTLGASYDLVARASRMGAANARLGQVAAPALTAAARSPDQVRSDLGAGDRPLVLAVGRLAPQKAYDLLLDAAARWQPRDPQPLVLIAGEGPQRPLLQARIDAAELPVRLLGHRTDVPDLLAAADVVVLTSQWEARALIAQEALQAGRPLVATAVGGVPDLVGDAALLVPYGDPEALATAVGTLLDNPELAKRLSEAGRARAATWPDEPHVIDAVIAVYRELAGNARA
jgi:glycosyltransferase involved in cell wall biosynthesis